VLGSGCIVLQRPAAIPSDPVTAECGPSLREVVWWLLLCDIARFAAFYFRFESQNPSIMGRAFI
jgi:hypothetical protein